MIIGYESYTQVINGKHYNTQYNSDHDRLCSNFYAQTHYSILLPLPVLQVLVLGVRVPVRENRKLQYGFPYSRHFHLGNGARYDKIYCYSLIGSHGYPAEVAALFTTVSSIRVSRVGRVSRFRVTLTVTVRVSRVSVTVSVRDSVK